MAGGRRDCAGRADRFCHRVPVQSSGLSCARLCCQYGRRYPFDTESESLRRVHFTVLDPTINSVFAEVRPLISADGKTLFFSRRNHSDNIGREKDQQDIWSSTLQPDGHWSAPVNAGPTINSKHADAVCSVSADGSEIVFIQDGMSRNNLLLRAKRTGSGWSEPEPMTIENYYSDDPYVDFFYSFDSRILLMALTRKDSQGEQDLYVSRRYREKYLVGAG